MMNACLLMAAVLGVSGPVWDLKRDGADKAAPFEIPAEAIRDYGSFVAEATVKFGEVKPGNGISLFSQASGDVGWALGHTYVGTAGHGHPEITLNGSFFELPHPDAPCRGASGETHTFVFKARGGIVTAYYDGRIMRRFVSAITPAVAPIVVGGPHRRACAGVEFLDVKIWGPDYDFRVPGETEKLASGYRVGKGWSVKMPFDAPKDLPRVLCMGDSISGQYLGPLETKMKGRAAFCHWVNFVTDPKLFRAESYREVAELAPYKAIFFNNGLHSTSWTEAFVSDQRVLEIYREMVRGFRAGAPQAKLVYVNTTPHVDRKAAGGPKLSDTVPANVVRRLNRLAERVMKEENVKVLDAYALLGAHPEWTSDGVHWNNQGREALADAIAAELVSTGSSAGSRYSGIDCDVSALPKDGDFLPECLSRRVTERISTSGRHPRLKLDLRLDPSLGGERAVVSVSNGQARVVGARFRAVVAGAGLLLRQMRWREDGFELADGSWTFEPWGKVREAYFARHYHNWYHAAPAAEISRYVEDLALWGFNSIHNLFLPLLNFNDDWRTDPAAQEFMRDFAAVYRTCRQLDLEVGTDGVLNNMCRNPPKEFLATPGPRLTANGLNLCLSAPGCKDYIFREYREIYTRMKALGVKPDYVRFWPYDEGGCCCTNCAPWGGNGYLRLVEDGFGLAREFFPGVKSRVSMWWFTSADGEAFRRRLATDGLLAVDDTIGNYGISGDNRFTNLWETARQGKPLRQITFPEISMYGRRPWGGSGANPTPRRLVKSMRDGWCRSDGFSLYSEGCYEDIDKALLVRLYTDRSATAEDVLREYARFEFPGADEEKCAKLLLLLEENWNIGWPLRFIQKASDGERADFVRVSSAALALMEEIRSGLLPSARACWRWRLVEIRCRLDDELARERRLDTPTALALLKELVDMYHAEEVKGTYNDPQHGLLRPPYDPPNRPREKLSAERLREIEVLSGGK